MDDKIAEKKKLTIHVFKNDPELAYVEIGFLKFNYVLVFTALCHGKLTSTKCTYHQNLDL